MPSLPVGSYTVAAIEKSFADPPKEARPWAFWEWIDGNVSAKGITLDLENLQRQGMRGILWANFSTDYPDGPARCFGDEWWRLLRHATAETKRLGLEFSLYNAPGWSGSGGPRVPPENGMQMLVWKEVRVSGPSHYDAILPQPDGTAYREAAVLAVPIADDVAKASIQELGRKAFDERLFTSERKKEPPPMPITRRAGIVDLSALRSAEGRLVWDVPAGKWRVIRFGYASNGRRFKPAPQGGQGLVVNVLSPEGFDDFWRTDVTPMLEEIGNAYALFQDSWEVGFQNWTARMLEEFRARRGYDPLRWLPVLTGQVVEDVEPSERFLWDWRRTLGELVAEKYFGHFRSRANEQGVRALFEAYCCTASMFDHITSSAQADIPMAEFWTTSDECEKEMYQVASAAHLWNKRVIAAEAFTAGASDRWLMHPGTLKRFGDAAFCRGVNDYFLCEGVHQPWEAKPGLSCDAWGSHFNRGNTWFDRCKDFVAYLARCQMLLQSGKPVVDVLIFTGEDTPLPLPKFECPAGYKWDYANAEALLRRLRPQAGGLVTEDGLKYRLLVVPDLGRATPETLAQLRDLVKQGAAVLLGKRPERSPSLAGYPNCDQQVEAVSKELWGEASTPARGRQLGDGRVFRGVSIGEALSALGTAPDVKFRGPAASQISWVHRSLDDGEAYFVANGSDETIKVDAVFRVKDLEPELADPVQNRLVRTGIWRREGNRTLVPLTLGPSGSVFVIFRRAQKPVDPVVEVKCGGQPVAGIEVTVAKGERFALATPQPCDYELKTAAGRMIKVSVDKAPKPIVIEGAWDVRFPPEWGAPERVTFNKLSSWTERPEEGIKHFSGTAEYRRHITVPAEMIGPDKAVWLDLGDVQIMAEVFVNGKPAGTLWCKPFRTDVTKLLVAVDNELVIRVTNLWANRLIGDEQLPGDVPRAAPTSGPYDKGTAGALQWPPWVLEGKRHSPSGRYTFSATRFFTKDSALLPSGLLGPVRLKAERIVLFSLVD